MKKICITVFLLFFVFSSSSFAAWKYNPFTKKSDYYNFGFTSQVDETGIATGKIPKYNATTGKWEMSDDAGAASGAPTDATYITQTTNGTLSAEQALSSLSTGLMKVANGTGVITSITDSSTNWDTAYTHSQNDADTSTTNELPTAGTAIDVSGTEVSFDSTEVEAATWGAGGNASNIWTYNLSGTDVTVTFGSDLVTFSSSLTLGTGKNFKIGTTQWNSGDSIDGTKVANADLGDIGVSSGVWSVEDDSHAHTTTTISGLVDADMSNDALDPDKLVGDATDDDKVDSTIVEQHAGTDISADLEEEVTEGSLADSTIVSADIKNGEIVSADLSATAGITLAQTAMTAGRSLTISTNDILADAELYTKRFNVGLENPAAADDNIIQIESAGAFTITEIACSTDAGTATINFNENVNTTPDTAGTAILSADIVCDTGRQSSCASGCDVNTISNGTIAAGNLISMVTTSVASSPTKLRIHIKGTLDD